MLINRVKLWAFNNLSFLGFDKQIYINIVTNNLRENNIYIIDYNSKDQSFYGYRYSDTNDSYKMISLKINWDNWKGNEIVKSESKLFNMAVCDFNCCLEYLKIKRNDPGNFKIKIELSYDNNLPLCHYSVYYKGNLYKDFFYYQRVTAAVLASWLLKDKNKEFFYMYKIKENDFHKEL